MSSTKERMLELLADEATESLSAQEVEELTQLEAAFPELKDDSSFEKAAAAFHLASLDSSEEMPASLMASLKTDADSFFGTEDPEPQPSTVREVVFEDSKPSIMQWLGWAVAGVASVALAFSLWTGGFGSPEPIVENDPPPPTVDQKRDTLLASSEKLVRTSWESPTKDANLKGEVVWSDAKQEGYMTFEGLRVNDKSKEAYQLWIFDETQSEKTPIDGGVFDVSEDGKVVIPIKAKLAVKNPQLFAITVEKPGGVVVSDRKNIAALGKVTAS